MSKNKFGINSTFDAFIALNEILEEEKPSLKKRLKNSKLDEGVSVDVRSDAELDAAKQLRETKTEKDDTLEVIDVDADAVDQLQDNSSYVGKMLLQCNSCKATRFMNIDDLKRDENDKDLYNLEDECPHCHHKGSGYTLIGQVGETPQEEENTEASFDNEEAPEEVVFDNTDEVENAEEETSEEESSTEDAENETEESLYDETSSSDDTDEVDLAKLGDEFDVDDVLEDDTEEADKEDKKVKKESLEEGLFNTTPEYIFKVGDTFTTPIDFEDEAFVADTVYEIVELNEDDNWLDIDNGKYTLTYVNLDHPNVSFGTGYVDGFQADTLEDLSRQIFDYDPHISMEMINRFDPYASYHYGENNEEDEKAMASEFDKSKTEGLEEDLDMSTFEGSIANLIDTFTIEDNPVNIKLLNKNGSELGMYGSDDLPFNVKSQMMDTFNTDDNYLEVNVTQNGEGTTVNDLFNYYRPDENNQTTFVVTNIDTDEEQDFEDLTTFLETYGDYYIDGALGLRTLNIYIADGDLETEVEPLDDEELIELGKENAEKEEAEVTEESLIEEIIKSYPGLKLNRINNSLAEEYFIAESIRLNEDIDLVYKNFVKPTSNEKLIEHFKSYTGYEDEVDKFLKEHNISKENYNKLINESADDEHAPTLLNVDSIYSPEKKIAVANKLKAIYNDPNTKQEVIDEIDHFLQDFIDLSKMNGIDDIDNEILAKVYYQVDRKGLLNEVVSEKLLTSVKTRAELGEAISKLVSANEKYRIAKSLTEGYRYDVFVNENCKLNEGLFDLAKEDEPETTALVPEGMREEDVEIVNKIDRIAEDIANAIENTYGVPAKDKKALIVADIIRDLQLIGGEKLADELEDTPWDNLTKQMYQEFNGFYDALDDLVSFTTGQRITTSQADKLQQAIRSLDGPSFETEEIQKQVESPQFLQAIQQGLIPYITPQELQAPEVSESCNEAVDSFLVDEDGDIEDPSFNLNTFGKNQVNEDGQTDLIRAKEIWNQKSDEVRGLGKELAKYNLSYTQAKTNDDKIIEQPDFSNVPEEEREKVTNLYKKYQEASRKNISARDRYYKLEDEVNLGLREDLPDNEEPEQTFEFENAEDVEKRLGELNYLQTQRELTTEEEKEFYYCQNLISNKWVEDDMKESINEDFNLDEFDEAVNSYLNESNELVGYRSNKLNRDNGNIVIEGVMESDVDSKPVTFLITKNENADNYTVSNNLFEDKFILEL